MGIEQFKCPGYENVPRAGSPGYSLVPRAACNYYYYDYDYYYYYYYYYHHDYYYYYYYYHHDYHSIGKFSFWFLFDAKLTLLVS